MLERVRALKSDKSQYNHSGKVFNVAKINFAFFSEGSFCLDQVHLLQCLFLMFTSFFSAVCNVLAFTQFQSIKTPKSKYLQIMVKAMNEIGLNKRQ